MSIHLACSKNSDSLCLEWSEQWGYAHIEVTGGWGVADHMCLLGHVKDFDFYFE